MRELVVVLTESCSLESWSGDPVDGALWHVTIKISFKAFHWQNDNLMTHLWLLVTSVANFYHLKNFLKFQQLKSRLKFKMCCSRCLTFTPIAARLYNNDNNFIANLESFASPFQSWHCHWSFWVAVAFNRLSTQDDETWFLAPSPLCRRRRHRLTDLNESWILNEIENNSSFWWINDVVERTVACVSINKRWNWFDSRSMLHLSGLFPCLLPNELFVALSQHSRFKKEKITRNPIPRCCLIASRSYVADSFYVFVHHIDFIHKTLLPQRVSCVCARFTFSHKRRVGVLKKTIMCRGSLSQWNTWKIYEWNRVLLIAVVLLA